MNDNPARLIEVWHRQEASMQLVAVVEIVSPHPERQDWELLEYAWRWSNNVEGSWSRPADLGGMANGDFNDRVHVLAELPVHQGKLYGLRSSMVGDVFVLGDAGNAEPSHAYAAQSFGFGEIDGWEPGNINFQGKVAA